MLRLLQRTVPVRGTTRYVGQAGEQQREAFEQHVNQWTDDDAEQHPLETNCGQRCLAALCVARDMGIESFLLL